MLKKDFLLFRDLLFDSIAYRIRLESHQRLRLRERLRYNQQLETDELERQNQRKPAQKTQTILQAQEDPLACNLSADTQRTQANPGQYA